MLRIVFVLLILLGCGAVAIAVMNLTMSGGAPAPEVAPRPKSLEGISARPKSKSTDGLAVRPKSVDGLTPRPKSVDGLTAPAPPAAAAPSAGAAPTPFNAAPASPPPAAAPAADPAQLLREVPIAHETPAEVIYGTPFEVTLSVDATAAAKPARGLPQRGNVVQGKAMVGTSAKALLTGTAFKIEALSPDIQEISKFAPNTWRWTVTANEPGPHDLVLEVFAMDGDRALPVHNYRDRLTVEITTIGRLYSVAQVANPFLALFGGLGSILGGAFGLFRYLKR